MTDEERNRQIARQAVEETLHRVGLDVENPEEMREDLAALRQFRRARDRGMAAAVWALTVAVVGGVVSLVWDALRGGPK